MTIIQVCQALLDTEQNSRLCSSRGIAELKKESWFRELSWSSLEKGHLDAPMAPGNVLDAGDGFMGAMFAASGGATQDANASSNGFFGNHNSTAPEPKSKKKSKRNTVPEEFDFRSKHS